MLNSRSSPFFQFILLIFLFIINTPLQAVTYTVTNLNDSGIGSLRQAVLDANNATATDDTIVFQAGLSGLLLSSGGFTITDNLAINGPGASLTINGNNAQRIFTINSGVTVTLSDLKLQNGGIENIGTLTLSNSTIQSSNWTNGNGGAITNGGTLTMNSSTLSGNSTGGSGGGIYNRGTLTLNNSTLSGNSASSAGGGICSDGGAVEVNNSTLSGNSTNSHGGGIFNDRNNAAFATLTLSNSTVSNNSTGWNGGGIHNTARGTMTIRNSTISSNLAPEGDGGGVFANGTVTVLNSTVTGNSTSAPTLKGGGIFIGSGALSIGNTLVASNISSNGKEIYNGRTFTSLGNNLFGENGSSGLVDANPINSDIILPGPVSTAIGPLTNNGGPTLTHAPVAGSPVLNAGNNALIPAGVTTDQRGAGFPRILSDTVDIGAVEGIPRVAETVLSMVLSGDYNADNRADLIWRNQTSGQVYGMLLDGPAITQQGLFYSEPNTAWRIIGNGDFDGNGNDDLLWWNDQTGQTYRMSMNGLTVAGGAPIYQEPNVAW